MENQLLSKEELFTIKEELSEWNFTDSILERGFTFSNFIDAFSFMTKVAMIAESIGHHPDWSNSYAQVNIQLRSHDLGGISAFDIKLARKINKLEKAI